MNKHLPKPVDWDQLYPGRFLKSGQLLGRKILVTISDVIIDELEGDKGKQIKGIIVLKEKGMEVALNRTNGCCLRAMFGRHLNTWKGKRIWIYPTQVRFGPNMVDAIRIWGSPDIERDITATIQLPRRKPQEMTMHASVDEKQSAPLDVPDLKHEQTEQPQGEI